MNNYLLNLGTKGYVTDYDFIGNLDGGYTLYPNLISKNQ